MDRGKALWLGCFLFVMGCEHLYNIVGVSGSGPRGLAITLNREPVNLHILAMVNLYFFIKFQVVKAHLGTIAYDEACIPL